MSASDLAGTRSPEAVRPLRLAVILERDGCPEWVARTLEDISGSGFAHIVALRRDATAHPASPAAAYATADAERTREAPDPLATVTQAHLAARLPGLADLPDDAGDLDAVLDFGRGEAPFLPARAGAWSFRFGSERALLAGDGLFAELSAGATGCELTYLAAAASAGPTTVIYRSMSHVNDMSLWRTRAPVAWKARAIVGRCLARLAVLGTEAFLAEARGRFDQTPPPVRPAPTAFGVAAFKARLLARRLITPYRFVREQWRVAIRVRRPGDPKPGEPGWGGREWARGFRFIEAPFDRFFADPFLFEHDGRTWLFLEDWDWAVGKAIISAAPVRDDGTLGPLETVLDTPYHLSNPLVFRHGGDIFMIPETLAARRVEVYRCLSFPTRWELFCTPIEDLDIADACVVQRPDGRWWLFAAVLDFGGLGWDELHVFHADALCGPYLPVPGNPVVSDVRAARPGGRMAYENGALMRFAQDCAGRYGSGLGLFIAEPAEGGPYRQRQVAKLSSFDFGMNGVHAYDATERFETVDGRHYQLALGRLRWNWPLPRWLGKH